MAVKTVTIVLDDRKLQEIIQATEGGVRRRVIHDGVEYGVYVELGTSRMGARPCLVPAFENHTKDLPNVLGRAIETGANLDDVIGKIAFDIQADYQGNVPVDTGALKNSIETDTE